MAEAIGLGASVVAFIGLAGQVAQGCKFVRDVLGDIKDASNDIRALRTEIQLFELAVDHFRASLAEIEAAGMPVPASYEAGIGLALEYSEEATASLLGLIAKKGSGETIRSRIKFAFRKDKCNKHLDRLGRAKGYISTAQSSILLLIQQHGSLGTRATHRALGSLMSTCELSATPLASIPARLDEAHTKSESIRKEVSQLRNDFSTRLHELSTGISTILNSKFSASTNIVSETRDWTATSYHTIEETRSGVEYLGNSSDGLESLPMGMSELVKDTFRGALADFYLACRNSAHDGSPSKCGVAPISEQPRLRRKVIQQTTSTRRYLRAIGIITVQSTTTTFLNTHETEISDKTTHTVSTVTQTQVELNPDPDLLRMGVYLSFVQHGFAEYPSHPEHNLRVFNIIDSDAPIVRACCSGDRQNVRELFATRKASPLDRVWGDRSLLDLVLNRFLTSWNAPRSIDRQTLLEKLLVLFGELVQYGLDPGQQRKNDDTYGSCPLGALAELKVKSQEDMMHISNLARTILSRSTQDPFSGFSFSTVNCFDYLAFKVQIVGLQIPFYTFLQTQDEWPVIWTPAANLRTKFLTAIQGEANLPPIFFAAKMHYPGLSSPTLDEILIYDPDVSSTDRILDCYPSLDDKLRVFSKLCRLMRTSQGGSIGYQSCLPRLQGRLVEKFVLCLHACQFSGLDLNNPPLEFHQELRAFRVEKCLHIIDTALLRSGIARELVDDLLEAELYSSLAFQLANIKHVRNILPWELLPTPLRYYDLGNKMEATMTEFWNSKYKSVTYSEPSSDTESLTTLDSDKDDYDESDTWSDFQERRQYPWDYDHEDCLENLFGEHLEFDNQDDIAYSEEIMLGIGTDPAQGSVLIAGTEVEVEKKEMVGIKLSRCDDLEENEADARIIAHARPGTPDIVDERLDGIAVAWNAFWT